MFPAANPETGFTNCSFRSLSPRILHDASRNNPSDARPVHWLRLVGVV
jgi:hypothetical protein